jgi:hypothetical protein
MKNTRIYGLCVALSLLLTACFKDLEIRYDGPTQVEFEQAVRLNPAVGRTYPIISAANPTTAVTTQVAQLNLVGPQRSSALQVRVLIEPSLTTALPTSYTLANGGNVVIPANSSVGSLSVIVARATSTTAPLSNLVLTLDSTSSEFKASPNYKRIGYSIRN